MIEDYRFGHIVIDGREYTSDVIVYPDRVDASWWRKEGHLLQIEDLEEVVQAQPEVLVVGTGNPGLMEVPQETREYLRSRGIELIVQPTPQAWQTYNRLSSQRRTVAALHLTC